jgi:hypothetical protein
MQNSKQKPLLLIPLSPAFGGIFNLTKERGEHKV